MDAGKIVIFSAPSGAGKSALLQYILQQGLKLEFSISVTSRPPRGNERHGREYYFLTVDEFRERIRRGDFLEYQEVYAGCYYGTLKSEIDRIWAEGKNVVLDVDVVGGINIKQLYGDRALALFIAPPSIETLEQRLRGRATDAPEKIMERIGKAEYEMSFAPRFDKIVLNDRLEEAQVEVENLIRQFLQAPCEKQD